MDEFDLRTWILGLIATVLTGAFSYLAYDFFQGLKEDASKLKEQQVVIIKELASANERDKRFFDLHNENREKQTNLEHSVTTIKAKQDALLMAMNDVENTLLTSVAMKHELKPVTHRLAKLETKIELYHEKK